MATKKSGRPNKRPFPLSLLSLSLIFFFSLFLFFPFPLFPLFSNILKVSHDQHQKKAGAIPPSPPVIRNITAKDITAKDITGR
jgi:hypothetical protein